MPFPGQSINVPLPNDVPLPSSLEEKETYGTWTCARLTHSRYNRQDQQQAAHDYHLVWSIVVESQTGPRSQKGEI